MRGEDEEETDGWREIEKDEIEREKDGVDGDRERGSRRDGIEDTRRAGGGMCAGRDKGLSAICG
jgi:hypothetical protein